MVSMRNKKNYHQILPFILSSEHFLRIIIKVLPYAELCDYFCSFNIKTEAAKAELGVFGHSKEGV